MADASLFQCDAVLEAKQCSECKATKPREEFYRHPKGAGGLFHICKDCHKARMRLRQKTNPRVQEYDRARAKTEPRRALNRKISKRWNEANPLGYKAHTAVGNAIRDGKLKKGPCGICSTTERVHAHHKDYAKPLDVIWLCAKCHHRLHALFPELEGANKREAG